MALFDSGSCTRTMEQLLARERAAVLRGDFRSLEKIANETERLVARLGQSRPDPEDVADLRRMSDRNGALLEAARQGLSDARRKLEALNTPLELHTYDSAGRRTTLFAHPKALTRRE